MISTIYIFVAWGLSILIAWGNVHVTKGIDWYSPITNQHRILLIFVNSAVAFSIVAFFLRLLLIYQVDFIVWNILMFVLFLQQYGLFSHKKEKAKKRIKNRQITIVHLRIQEELLLSS